MSSREEDAILQRVAKNVLPWWQVFMRNLEVSIYETAQFVDEENLRAMTLDEELLERQPAAQQHQTRLRIAEKLRERIITEKRRGFTELLEVRAPLTSILIVFEMTHEFALVPTLMLGGIISQAVSRALVAHKFRREAESELAAGRPVPVHDAPTCLREDAIGEVQMRLVERGQGVILLLDRDGGVVVGLLTLHDLLRAQASFTKGGEPPG